MKSKGKIAWLITWEGPESEHNGRCKVVAILPPQRGQSSIASLLPVLFAAEYNYTLCEKMGSIASTGKNSFFLKAYRDINPEFWYGYHPRHYLCARRVEHLRCEESKRDCLESTLYWTELPKFIPNPKYGPEGPTPENIHDALKEVIGETEAQYTYSIRSRIDEERKQRAAQV